MTGLSNLPLFNWPGSLRSKECHHKTQPQEKGPPQGGYGEPGPAEVPSPTSRGQKSLGKHKRTWFCCKILVKPNSLKAFRQR